MSARTGSYVFDGVEVPPGAARRFRLKVSESAIGDPVSLPVQVVRGAEPGPTVFVTAAIHGVELNGVGIIHMLMHDETLAVERGALILVPVINIFGFETQNRYMPDRRDLNRCFPGSPEGSLSARVADVVFRELVQRSDYGIDLHTAASGRTNFPNVRGDFTDAEVLRAAKAFGCELLVQGAGPEGSFRREAVAAGCPTITLEAGEPYKIEPTVLETGVRGVRNVLVELGMTSGPQQRPEYQVRIERSTWVRAEVGGILRFHVSPGEIIEKDQAIATNASIFGDASTTLVAPVDGVVLGMTTLPIVKPGEPVCHIAVPHRPLGAIRRALDAADDDSLHHRIREDLATSIAVTEEEGTPAAEVPEDT